MNDAAAFCKRGEWAKCCKELAATELWSSTLVTCSSGVPPTSDSISPIGTVGESTE